MTPAEARAFRQFGASVIAMPKSSAAALAGEGQTIASTNDWLAVRWAKP
jgi:purine nucleoside phosphorylase